MIQYYRKSSAKKNTVLLEVNHSLKGTWVRLTKPAPEEIDFISKKYSLDKTLFDDIFDEESVPVIEKETEDGYIYVVVRIPCTGQNGGIVTAPFGIIFLSEKKIIITVSNHDDIPTQKLIEKNLSKFRTDKKSVFFAVLLRRILNSYMRELQQIEKEIKEVEKSVKHSLENKEIVQLLSLQKTLVYFRTAMVGNKKVVSKITSGRIFSVNEENKDLLEDALIDIDEAQQLVSIYSEIIKNTVDAYSSIVSNNLNVIMKFLALVTIALSIPTMIFSFYGMNIALPLQQEALSVVPVVCFSLILTAIVIFYFKMRKWV